MFDISWGKLVIIGVVALIVIGPKELPGVLRMVGQWLGKMRRMAAEFQGQFQEAMREAEMADLKKQFDDTTSAVNSAFDTSTIQNDLNKMVNDPLGTDQTTATSTPATPPTDSTQVATPATSNPAVATPTDPAALGTGPAAPEPKIDVPMPDLPPPVTNADFTPPAPSAEATPKSEAPKHDAPATPQPAEGGKAA